MPEKKRDETRRLLKIFGVAMTDFEDESKELLNRIQALEGRTGDELAGVLRDFLELIAESTEKWQATTDHLFSMQRKMLADIVTALPERRG